LKDTKIAKMTKILPSKATSQQPFGVERQMSSFWKLEKRGNYQNKRNLKKKFLLLHLAGKRCNPQSLTHSYIYAKNYSAVFPTRDQYILE